MGMTSFDGSDIRHLQAELGRLLKPSQYTTTANVMSKVKSAIASAFRVSAPAMALA